jgi:transposase
MLLDKISNDLGILEILKESFPNDYLDILSLSYYIVQTGEPLSNCNIWSRRYIHPSNSIYSSQNITNILDNISTDSCNLFLNLWLNKFINTEYLCYDITSISSYNKGIQFVKYGYNRDHERLPQINLALLFGQHSKLPVYYRRLQGNITDVKTLDITTKSLELLGIKSIKYILDRGFYSENNVSDLLSCPGTHFTLAVPIRRKWVEKIIDRYSDNICSLDKHHQLDDDEFVYAVNHLYKWQQSRRRLYLHIYYNDLRAAEDHSSFITELKNYKESLEKDNKPSNHNDYFDKYLIIKDTPVRGLQILYNDDEIIKHRKKYAGYFCILSTIFVNSIEALDVYRNRDLVEKIFDDLKNEIDRTRIRVHSTNRMDAKLFLHFIALILISHLRNIYKDDKILKHFSYQQLVRYMETLEQTKIEGTFNTYYTEPDKIHNRIFDIFDLSWPGQL